MSDTTSEPTTTEPVLERMCKVGLTRDANDFIGYQLSPRHARRVLRAALAEAGFQDGMEFGDVALAVERLLVAAGMERKP